jgi:abnormal spindle-like microcephaly-associated protein
MDEFLSKSPQNLFRARKALKETSLAREEALKQYIVKRLQSIWRGRKARRHAAIKYLMQSGVEKSAIKIQRKYRQTRRMRKAQKQIQVVFQKQLEKYTILVQRRFRASRAMHIANLITRARRKQREKEVEAAVHLQRLWRGRKGRHQFNLYRTKKEAKEKEEKEASIRLQALYRGREDRKKAQELAKQKRHVEQLQNQKAIQIQAIYRRKLARREVERRRQMIRERELAAIKLQTAYRTRHAKQKVDIIRMAKYRIECERAAHLIQKRWRTRKDRLGLQILCNIRRNKNEKRNKAASFLQQVWRKYAIRQKAHSVVDQLLAAKRHAEEMEIWAATLVQAHWRRIQAIKEVKCIQAEKRTRWKQLVDTYNHHGKGFGAPFYYVSHCDLYVYI